MILQVAERHRGPHGLLGFTLPQIPWSKVWKRLEAQNPGDVVHEGLEPKSSTSVFCHYRLRGFRVLGSIREVGTCKCKWWCLALAGRVPLLPHCNYEPLWTCSLQFEKSVWWPTHTFQCPLINNICYGLFLNQGMLNSNHIRDHTMLRGLILNYAILEGLGTPWKSPTNICKSPARAVEYADSLGKYCWESVPEGRPPKNEGLRYVRIYIYTHTHPCLICVMLHSCIQLCSRIHSEHCTLSLFASIPLHVYIYIRYITGNQATRNNKFLLHLQRVQVTVSYVLSGPK